jgi:uncharacterized protein YdcH (DUF465 family)
MTRVAHELSDDFPEQAQAIHALKGVNAHFGKLADRYHELNRTLHRMETNLEPADDLVMEEFKKERLKLKDEIAALLKA